MNIHFYGVEGLERGLKVKPFTSIKEAKEWVSNDKINRFVMSSDQDIEAIDFFFTEDENTTKEI